jgi:hypothetical protein
VNEELIPNLCETFEGHEFRYAHDRAPWFVSHKSQRYFQEETPSSVNVVSPPEFPPNSPDINLAERAMANVLKRLSKRVPTPKSKDDVKSRADRRMEQANSSLAAQSVRVATQSSYSNTSQKRREQQRLTASSV